jgi:hypothetical protein
MELESVIDALLRLPFFRCSLAARTTVLDETTAASMDMVPRQGICV